MARPVLSMLGNRQFFDYLFGRYNRPAVFLSVTVHINPLSEGGIISSLTSLLWNNVIRETPTSSLGASGTFKSAILWNLRLTSCFSWQVQYMQS